MAFRAHYCFHLTMGREIKKTLNAGRRGDFARDGTGLTMLNLSNGETDALFFQRTLNQKNRRMKHVVMEKKSVEIIQMGQLHIALYVPQQYAGGNPQLLVILHQQLHIPLQQCLYMIWILIVDDVVADGPENCAIRAGLGIGKRRLWIITWMGMAFSLTPFLDGKPVACWTVKDVIAIGECGGYTMATDGGAEEVAESILLSLQFHQQFASFVGCQGGRLMNDGDANTAAGP